MSPEAAKQIIGNDKTFDIEDSGFGDGSVTISIAEVFDSRSTAEDFIKAIRVFCSIGIRLD